MPDKKNTIGRFEIIEKIGEGPIGAVYKALDPVIRRTVAIKVIKLYTLEETATFAEVFEKIYRVVRTSTALNHPNICIIYDLSEEKKIPFITMEYVDGHDIEWLLQNKHQFKRAEVLNILQQTCDALDFAHRKNVIHQDLKSTNLILTSELHVKITDFGIAGLDEIAAAQTKKLLSIPYYIAPEQALGEKVTPASDLFSLGIIMYQLLSGQLPFPGTSAANVIMMIARDNPAMPRDFEKSGIKKDDWESFFSIALAKQPGQRFRSAKEMHEALSAILPPGETRYYPYSYQGEAVADKLEKTFVNESPTVMLDAAQFDQDEAGRNHRNRTEWNLPSLPQPASAFDLLDEAVPAVPSVEPESTLMMGQEETQFSAPPTVMIEVPKQPLKPEPPPFVSASAPTQMISVKDLSAQMKMGASNPPPPEPEPEYSMEPELDMATMMVETPTPPPVAPPPPEPPPPPAATMRPEPSSYSEPTIISNLPLPEPTPPTSSPTMPPQPPAGKAMGKQRKPEPPTPPPSPPREDDTPAPAAVTASRPAPVAQTKAGGGSLKLLGIIAVAIAILVLLVGGIFFIVPKLTHKETPAPLPAPQPIRVEPKPVAPPPPVTPEPQLPVSGKLTITSDPAGATVFVDEQEKGVTPVEVPDLSFGKHIVKVTMKGFQDNQQEVELTDQLTEVPVPIVLEKAVPQMGTLVVQSNPPGAFIIVNNRALGQTPKTLTNQKPGKLAITLKLDGYHDYSETVKVSPGKSTTVNGNLQEIPKVVVKAPEPVKPVEPEVKPGQLVPLSSDVERPKPLKKVGAKYPDAAKRERLEGIVGLDILISETGQVIDVKVTKSANAILDQAAIEAVRQWTYKPATKKGVVVKVWLPVTMSFQSGR